MSDSSRGRTAVSTAVFATLGVQRTFVLAGALAVVALTTAFYPTETKAGIFDEIKGFWQPKVEASASSATSVQTIALPQAALNIDPNPAKGGGDVTVLGGALVPEEGPAGTIAEIEKPKNQSISIYVVREGDTLSGIAQMFGVSVNTIKWANEIPPSGTIKIGQTLTILPITSVKHVVKKGDTLESIAKQYKADATEISNYNQIEGSLAVGTEIIIPDGEIAAPTASRGVAISPSASVSAANGYYSHPVPGARRTQGVHGYNGVDLAAPIGTAVYAAAAGDVIIARSGGYNGGYGSYVVIRHDNGTQTLYAHLSSVSVGVGETVGKGSVVGGVGNSGRSTGAHLHFEVRGARNPF